jgi:hypothetical protein
MQTDLEYHDWIIRENPHLADGNAQKYLAIPPANSRFHKKTYPTLEAAKESIGRRQGGKVIQTCGDDLLQQLVMARRKVAHLKGQLETAVTEMKTIKKEFTDRDPLLQY